MCGIVGVVGERVMHDLGNATHFLQHRGPGYGGFFLWDPRKRVTHFERGEGLADDVFKPFADLEGNVGVSHTRYKTHGNGGRENAQPFFDPFRKMALGQNGHLTNVDQIADELAARGERLTSSCDGEALLRVLSAWYETLPNAAPEHAMLEAISQTQRRVKGAFSVVVARPEGLYAFKDPHGFRPLVIGRKEGSVMAASETLALEQNGYAIVQELAHGEAAFIDNNLEIKTTTLHQREPMPCAFELIYFADVESKMLGKPNRHHRWEAGRTLAALVAEQDPELLSTVDLVVPIPNSPIPGAEAFAQYVNKHGGSVQYATPVSKYRYGRRIFMGETQEEREAAGELDFRLDEKAVRGKNIFLIDDSIVRGTNSRIIVKALREAGAGKVYFGTLWPTVITGCQMGINTPTTRELIGGRYSGDQAEIQQELGVDALFYMPEDRFRENVLHNQPACMACTTSKRAVSLAYAGNVLP
jgi:amidophosphoribosyltransferase